MRQQLVETSRHDVNISDTPKTCTTSGFDYNKGRLLQFVLHWLFVYWIAFCMASAPRVFSR